MRFVLKRDAHEGIPMVLPLRVYQWTQGMEAAVLIPVQDLQDSAQSHSAPLPSDVGNIGDGFDGLVERLALLVT